MPADHDLQKFHCFTTMQQTSLFSTLMWSSREVVSAAHVCKLSGGLCKAYLIFLLKHFKHFHAFPPMDT